MTSLLGARQQKASKSFRLGRIPIGRGGEVGRSNRVVTDLIRDGQLDIVPYPVNDCEWVVHITMRNLQQRPQQAPCLDSSSEQY